MADDSVRKFFDDQATDYHSRRAGMRSFHRVAAERIEAGLDGSVLSVGGLWIEANLDSERFAVTIADLSRAMLAEYELEPVTIVQADASALPFSAASFDHVVLPLILHHVAGVSAEQAQRGVARVLTEVRRVLEPGGRLWISEFCVTAAVYAVELAAVPVTRRLLASVGAPLVVMHTRRFYERALAAAGFGDIRVERVQAADARATDWITPVIGFPVLKVPRALYPVTPTLITATAGGRPAGS
jgi:ubiquinone/menaquinone biosynthesis C-methylase UbiE